MLKMAVFHFFSWLSNIALYIRTMSLCSHLLKTLGLFPCVLAVVNKVAVNFRAHISLRIYVFKIFSQMPRRGIGGVIWQVKRNDFFEQLKFISFRLLEDLIAISNDYFYHHSKRLLCPVWRAVVDTNIPGWVTIIVKIRIQVNVVRIVLVHLGCYTSMIDWLAYEQQTDISHSSGGREIQS